MFGCIAVGKRQGLLRQIFYNLADNAVKYSTGERTVEIELKREGKQAILTISNPSTDFDGEEAARVFERFFRQDSSRNRSHSGAGLGLSLANEIAMSHGTQIQVSRTRPGYAVFQLALETV